MKGIFLTALLAYAVFAAAARAADHLSADEVGGIAEAWLASSIVFRNATDSLPAGQSFSTSRVRPIPETGPVQAYGIALRPAGYVIVAADRRMRPIIAFSTDRVLDLCDDPANVFRALLLDDLSGCYAVLAEPGERTPRQEAALALNGTKWDRLERVLENPGAVQSLDFYGTNVITEPMLQTR
jgi:hypothetical protein